MLVALAASVISILTASPPPSPGCAYDDKTMQALGADAFDQDLKGGWRSLADRKCYVEAATLVRDYRESHRATLAGYQVHLLYWHEGQMRAFAGQSQAAIPLMMAGTNPYDAGGFTNYALGSIAFLQHDRAGLSAARARLAAEPKPDTWSETVAMFKAKGLGEPKWPNNLDVLNGLIRCFDKPYAVAYGQCRGTAQTGKGAQ